MTTIKLSGGLVLRADASGWIISEEKSVATGKHAGETRLSDISYPGSLYNALIALQDLVGRRSEATTLEGLIHAITALRTEISAALEPTLTVRVPK